MKIKMIIIVVLLSIFLVACQGNPMIDNTIESQNASDFNQDVLEQINYQDYDYKFSSDLLTTIENANDSDMISVYVFKKNINSDDFRTRLLELGIDEDIYNDEQRFLAYVISLYGNDLEKIAEERLRYRTLRLQVIKEITVGTNQDFINKYELSEDQIIYNGFYTTTLIIEIPMHMLSLIASDDNVLNLSLYIEDIITNEGIE